MSADNLVVLSGKVGFLETKKAGETNLSEFSLGVYNWRNKKSDYYKVQLWGAQSDRLVSVGAKDKDEIRIVGELSTNEWEKDGKKNKTVIIRGTDFSYDVRQNKDAAVAGDAGAEPEDAPF